MGPVISMYSNLGLIFLDSQVWEDCWPKEQLVWPSVAWDVRAIPSSQCINKLPLTLRTLGNVLLWHFHYKHKWEYNLPILRVFLKYQPTCSSSWLPNTVWYSCMWKICRQLCFLFKVTSHNWWVSLQGVNPFVMDSSLIYAQWLSKTLLYTKTGIEKNKMIY